jgi:hypothetical protein
MKFPPLRDPLRAGKFIFSCVRAGKKQTHMDMDGNRESALSWSTFSGNLNGWLRVDFSPASPLKRSKVAPSGQQVSAEMSNPPARHQLILIILLA